MSKKPRAKSEELSEFYLEVLHGEHIFDDIVPQSQRDWWYGIALHNLVGHCQPYAQLTEVITWPFDGGEHLWKTYALDPAAPTDVDTISKTIEWTFQSLESGEGNCPDLRWLSLYREVKGERTIENGLQLNAEHLSAVLRVLWLWKDTVPCWKQVLHLCLETYAFDYPHPPVDPKTKKQKASA